MRVFLYLTYILYYIFAKKSKIQIHKMAERMGFEPMHGYSPPNALAKRPLKPTWVPLEMNFDNCRYQSHPIDGPHGAYPRQRTNCATCLRRRLVVSTGIEPIYQP